MTIKLFDKKVNLVALIVLAHLTFSYYYFPWFYSAFTGFIVIIILSYFTWKSKYRFWIGLQFARKEYLIILIAVFVFLGGSFLIGKTIAKVNNIQVIPGNYKNLIHVFFYTLNEEIVLGSLLLKGIQNYRKKLPKWVISVGIAICFSIIHFVFYKWIFKNSGSLSLITLISLFLTGIIRNNLILKSRHIGYSWALHFGWIYFMLASSHYNLTNKLFLNDFQRFELYLGDYRTLVICLLLAGLSFYFLKRPTSS